MAAGEGQEAETGAPEVTGRRRGALPWKFPLFAILLVMIDFAIMYLGYYVGGDWTLLGVLLMLVQAAIIVVFLVTVIVSLCIRRLKFAASVLLAAIILGTLPWYAGPFMMHAIDAVRFYVVRDRYDAIIAKMSPEERASAVLFFDWGESGGAGVANLFFSIVYDESGEILLSDAERSQAWKEKVYAHNNLLEGQECRTSAFRLSGHFYLVDTVC